MPVLMKFNCRELIKSVYKTKVIAMTESYLIFIDSDWFGPFSLPGSPLVQRSNVATKLILPPLSTLGIDVVPNHSASVQAMWFSRLTPTSILPFSIHIVQVWTAVYGHSAGKIPNSLTFLKKICKNVE